MKHEKDQPLPKPVDGPSMQALVINELKHAIVLPLRSELLRSLIVRDLEARIALGIERYGQALKAFDGRDNLLDAYHEALDLVVYLRKDLHENPGMATPTYISAIEILAHLRERLQYRDADLHKVY